MSAHKSIFMLFTFPLLTNSLPAQDKALPKKAAVALRKAVNYFTTKVGPHGGYVWQYSADLKYREGEGKATKTMGWVQPPGTPSVGLAFLRAYEATGDKFFLDAATDTALALADTQLMSGGWDYRIEFDRAKRTSWAYRVDKRESGRNVTTLDDNTTQEAVRLLLRVHIALGGRENTGGGFGPKRLRVCMALDYAAHSLLRAQYRNGAWPQRFSSFPDRKKFPVKKASYPKSWSRTYPSKKYTAYYTLNDNTLADMIDVMLKAGRVSGHRKYMIAAKKAGDFIIMAQMPEPQPAWAQQYDGNMHPAWARKFEPPAITGGESYGAMRALLQLYRETGDKKFLAPIPKALAYFKKVRLKNGQLARFYELKTSKPLYFTKQYKLTYSDADMPTHYGFKVSYRMDRIEREYERLRKLEPKKLNPKPRPLNGKPSRSLIAQVKKVIADQDKQGRWVEKGVLRTMRDKGTIPIIASRTLIRNVDVLSDYLRYFRN